MSENPELDAALLKLDTRHRFEIYLMKLGASDEAAKLIASSPDQAAKMTWDGVNLHFGKSDLAAVDDPAAKAHFADGPFKTLFATAADETDGDNHAQPDPALLDLARAGNKTAYSKLARDSFNGDIKALDAALAPDGNGDDHVANGHDSKNPFLKFRRKDGTVDPVIAEQVAGMIRAFGTKKVSAIAAACGRSITGLPLRA